MYAHRTTSNEWSSQRRNSSKSQKTSDVCCALYSEICNVGSSIQSSKKRITWRLSVAPGQEHEVSLTHSIGSGKKVLRLDGAIVHQSRGLPISEWDNVFHVKGNHVLHCMIRPTLDLNDMYDLIVDGISFRRLPQERIAIEDTQPPHSIRTRKAKNLNSKSQLKMMNDHSMKSSTSSTSSSIFLDEDEDHDQGQPWACHRCTFLNTKTHALMCEMCISPRIIAEEKPAQKPAQKSKQPQMSNSPFDTASVFDPFEDSEATPEPRMLENKGIEFNPFKDQVEKTYDAASASLENELTSALNELDFSIPAAPVAIAVEQPTLAPIVSPATTTNPAWECSDMSNLVSLNNIMDDSSRAPPGQSQDNLSNTTMTLEQARQSSPNALSLAPPVLPIQYQSTPQMMMYPIQQPSFHPGQYQQQPSYGQNGNVPHSAPGPKSQYQPANHHIMHSQCNTTTTQVSRAKPSHNADDPFANLS